MTLKKDIKACPTRITGYMHINPEAETYHRFWGMRDKTKQFTFVK